MTVVEAPSGPPPEPAIEQILDRVMADPEHASLAARQALAEARAR